MRGLHTGRELVNAVTETRHVTGTSKQVTSCVFAEPKEKKKMTDSRKNVASIDVTSKHSLQPIAMI